jgi:hypothetical protein
MTVHELKIWPVYYQAVRSGSKTFEIRENDRGFQKGDRVVLREFDPDAPTGLVNVKGAYTGSLPLQFDVGFILPIDSKYVVFSLIPYKQEPPSYE